MALEPNVVVQSVFERAPNAAIVAFGARPSLGGSGSGEAYVQVANYSTTSRAVRLVVSRGQTVLSDQRADMAAGEAVSAIVPLTPTGSARLVARIETTDDALAEDNEAVAWIDGSFCNADSTSSTAMFSPLPGGRLSIGGVPVCGPKKGLYRWKVANGRLTLTKLRDTCPAEVGLFTGVWKRG